MEPVGSENAAAMLSVAAGTTGSFLREDDPACVVHCDLLARGCLVWRDRATDNIIAAVGAVNALPIIGRIILELPVHSKVSFVNDPAFIKVNPEGIVEARRV